MKNRFFDTDKSLANRGWTDLQKTLDREMPQQRRRRRFLWLWWLLPGLLAGGTWAYWHLQPGQSVQPATIQPLEMPKPLEPVALVTPQKQEENGKDNITPSLSTQTHTPEYASAVHHPASPAPRPQLTNNLTTPEVTPEPATVAAYTTNTQASENAVNQTLVTSVAPSRQSVSGFAALPANLRLIDPPSPVISFFPTTASTKITSSSTSRLWAFGLNAGLSSLSLSGLNGGTLGFTTDFQMSRHWGIRSGLAYGYEKLPVAVRTLISVPAVYDTLTANNVVIIEDVVAPSGGQYSNSVPAEVQTQVSAVHRLEMPLLLWWQPLRHWRLYAGGTMARTLKVETGNRTAAIEDNKFSSNQISDPENRLSSLAAQRVSDWQAALQGGIGFRPSRRFEFGFFSQYVPKALLSSNNNGQFLGAITNADQQSSKASEPFWRFHLNATLFF